jgi:hypothetical protein
MAARRDAERAADPDTAAGVVRLVIGKPIDQFIAYTLAGRHYSVSSVRRCALFRCHLVEGWLTKLLIAAGRCQQM